MKNKTIESPVVEVIDVANHDRVEYLVQDLNKSARLRVIFENNCIEIYRENELMYEAILKTDRWYRESVFTAILKTLIKRVQPIEKEIVLVCKSGKLAKCHQGVEYLNMNEVLHRVIRRKGWSGKIWKKKYSLVGNQSFIKALIDIEQAVLLISISLKAGPICKNMSDKIIIEEEVNIEEIWSD